MMKVLTEIFTGKKSNIKKIIIFGEYPSSINGLISDERVTYLCSDRLSPKIALKALNSDLNIGFTNISYAKKNVLEVIYLAEDKESERMAKKFVSFYKSKFLSRDAIPVPIQSNSQYYVSVAYLKDLKLKIIIKVSEIDTYENIASIFNILLKGV